MIKHFMEKEYEMPINLGGAGFYQKHDWSGFQDKIIWKLHLYFEKLILGVQFP